MTDIGTVFSNQLLEKINNSKKLKKFRFYFNITFNKAITIVPKKEYINVNWVDFDKIILISYMITCKSRKHNYGDIETRFFKDSHKLFTEKGISFKKLEKKLAKIVKYLPEQEVILGMPPAYKLSQAGKKV